MLEQHNPQLQSQGIAQSILPIKSKACRSYSTNNQSLDQIMKKANEIIRKSKNSCAAQEQMNPKGLHGLGESFYALTTADSLQKNGSLSTNRERLKVSPFVTAASPEIAEDENHNKNIIFSSGNNNNKTFESCEKTERSSSQQSQEKQQQHHQSQTARVLSEADYFFENFDNLIRVSFGDKNIIQSQLEEQSPAGQNSSNSMIRSLLATFENIRKEQQQSQQQQLTILNQIANSAKQHQVSQTSSYLVPKQTQQTSISPYLLLPPTPSAAINYSHSQSQQSSAQYQQPSSQLQNESLDQYLKRPQPAKVKQASTFAAHPPLPSNVGRNSLHYSNNSKIAINNGMNNSASFRQRHSLKDKENNSDSANSCSFNNSNNNNNSYYSYGQSQMAPLMCSSNSSRHQPNSQYIFTTPTTATAQPIQSQRNNNTHQRSSSYIIEGTQNYLPSNTLTNSLGCSRPRSDSSVVGPSEILLPEPHLRTNGTYAPLKTKALLSNKSTDTPTSVRLNSSSSNNNSASNGAQPCFITSRNSIQVNNLPSGYHGIKGNKEQNQQCLLSNLLPVGYKSGQNQIQQQPGAAYQLNNNLSCSNNNSRSTSIPKQILGSQNISLQK